MQFSIPGLGDPNNLTTSNLLINASVINAAAAKITQVNGAKQSASADGFINSYRVEPQIEININIKVANSVSLDIIKERKSHREEIKECSEGPVSP